MKLLKRLLPLKLKIFVRALQHDWIIEPTMNNPFFGFLFDLFHRDYCIGDLRFTVPRAMTTVGFRARFWFDSYELPERTLAEKYINADDSVLELGGCIGIVSCTTNRQLTKPSRHLVVEANLRLIPILLENRDKNGCDFIVEHGLVSETSDGKFYLHDLIVGASANCQTETLTKVPVISFERLTEKHMISPTVIMMDIEGDEDSFVRENLNRLGGCSIADL